MNQLCKVCGEPAAGFHFGAFTCEGCKSFFGRTYNNISAIAGCKNNGDCVINKKNRTACKACRLRKCLLVGMSKSGSRYGRRSNWFKIHCLLQEQQTQHQQQLSGNGNPNRGINSSNLEQLNHFHQQLQARQTYQDKTNPSIKTASMSPTLTSLQPPPTIHSVHNHHRLQAQNTFLSASNKFLNGSGGTAGAGGGGAAGCGSSGSISQTKSEPRLSSSPSDSGASSAGDVGDDSASIATSQGKQSQRQTSPIHAGGIAKLETNTHNADAYDAFDNRKRSFNSSEPLMLFSPAAIRSPFAAIVAANLPPPTGTPFATSLTVHRSNTMPASLNVSINVQDEPIDLSVKSSKNCCRTISPPVTLSSPLTSPLLDIAHKPAPLDLTLVRPQPMSG